MRRFAIAILILCLSIQFIGKTQNTVHAQTPAPLQGDANGDGAVDNLDYQVWLTNSLSADFNADGKVDGIDYVIWLNHYGQVSPTLQSTSWLWASPNNMTSASMQSYLSFAKSRNIKTVYMDIDPYVGISAITDPTTRTQQINAFNASVNSFITMAQSYNIKVQGLAGDTDWANSTHNYLSPMLVDYILNYNIAHPSAPFDGMSFDIEFYNLSDFSANQITYSTNYLNLVSNLIIKVNNTNSNIKLSFAVPFWLDEDGPIPAFTYNGQSKLLAYHFLDVLNTMNNHGGQMLIMAYRNYADGIDGTIALSKNEINYAGVNAKNTSIFVGQDVANDTPSKITFYGLGQTTFNTEVAKINSAFATNPTYRGIAIEELVSYQKL